MTKEELQQELQRMRDAGWQPMLCDTAVKVVDVPVLAGYPAESGDQTDEKYVMLPRELVGRHPVFLIEAEGDSMKGVGIVAGDMLEVQMETGVVDGDIVVAEVNGGFTVKTFYTDGEGLQWLIPENSDYDAILLSGNQWRIVGKVIGVRKGTPRSSFSSCEKTVMRTRQKNDRNGHAGPEHPRPQAEELPNLVFRQFHQRRRVDYAAVRKQVERVVVMQMKRHYEWYAVYRVMMDLKLLDELKLTRFARQMELWFPDVAISCDSESLGVYATGHTGKAFSLWSSEAFRQDMRKGQSMTGFITLYHRCEELRAALFPLPVVELGLPIL